MDSNYKLDLRGLPPEAEAGIHLARAVARRFIMAAWMDVFFPQVRHDLAIPDEVMDIIPMQARKWVNKYPSHGDHIVSALMEINSLMRRERQHIQQISEMPIIRTRPVARA